MIRTVLITGANAGLGKDSARQLAHVAGVEKIYLACRNPTKGAAAQAELEQATGKKIFEVVSLDTSQIESARALAASIEGTVDAVILNAGGMGGPTPAALTAEGASHMFAINVLGHAVLVEELVAAGKVGQVVMYAGSEAARGFKTMRMKRPELPTSSVDDFAGIIDGSLYGGSDDPMVTYGPTKYVAAMWMAAMARRHPDLRFVTMSPGGTSGTSAADSMEGLQGMLMTHVAMPLMSFFGFMHGLEVGAARYVAAVTEERYKSGVFYASADGKGTGDLVDQATIFADLGNTAFQDNAYEAVQRFVPSA